MFNYQLSKIFDEIADYLIMQNINFKPRAYQRAARTLESLEQDVKEIYGRGGKDALEELPGIGESISEKIIEYIKTGRMKYYDGLKKKWPVEMLELTVVEGVGPKMVRDFYKYLKIKNLKELEKAARAGKIRELPNYKEKTEQNILQGIEFLKKSKGRFLLGNALPLSKKIEQELLAVPGVKKAVTAGSIRRRKETIGDIDVLVVSDKPKQAMDKFVSLPEVVHVYGKGKTKFSVRLNIGINADVRILPEKQFGSALLYFTGSKAHNIALRKIAIKKGYKLNEYGLFKGKKVIASKTEKDIYKALGMAWMEPELRTDTGEIEAAQKKKLPKIISYTDIQGDLQMHTTWSEGADSIEEMALACKKMGYKYIAITDHTVSLKMTGGMDEKKLEKQMKEIDRVNKKIKGIKILKGAEVNILKDGSLDINNQTLKKLNIVLIAIHSHFNMTKKQMTERIIKAMQNPCVDILAHPTGRLIKQRDSYEVGLEEIIKAAKKFDVALEINAYPDRLDLNDVAARQAKKAGVKLVINTDSHSKTQLHFMELGVAVARRAWVEKKDVINAWPLKRVLKWLKRRQKAN